MVLTLEQDVIFRSNLHYSVRNDQGVLAIRRIFSLVDMITSYTNFKNIKVFENLVFVIMSTRENLRLIARTPLLSNIFLQASDTD